MEKCRARFFKISKKYLEIGIKQRVFEDYKPFLLCLLNLKTEILVCYHQHEEIGILFKACMDYHRSIVSKDMERTQLFKVYDMLNELVDETL